jgi:hypothetical protein
MAFSQALAAPRSRPVQLRRARENAPTSEWPSMKRSRLGTTFRETGVRRPPRAGLLQEARESRSGFLNPALQRPRRQVGVRAQSGQGWHGLVYPAAQDESQASI